MACQNGTGKSGNLCRLQSASEHERAEAARKFKEAKEAYEVLSDGKGLLPSTVCTHTLHSSPPRTANVHSDAHSITQFSSHCTQDKLEIGSTCALQRQNEGCTIRPAVRQSMRHRGRAGDLHMAAISLLERAAAGPILDTSSSVTICMVMS